MVFILVFEFRRCFRLFRKQACSPSYERATMVQKMTHTGHSPSGSEKEGFNIELHVC